MSLVNSILYFNININGKINIIKFITRKLIENNEIKINVSKY